MMAMGFEANFKRSIKSAVQINYFQICNPE